MEIAILFLPLLASIISGFFGKLIGDRSSEIITSLFVLFQHHYHYLFFITLFQINMKVILFLQLGLIQDL